MEPVSLGTAEPTETARATQRAGSVLGAPRYVRVGVVGVAALFMCLAAFSATTLPWAGSLDSADHLDYVFQVSKGRLPDPLGSPDTYPDGRPDRFPQLAAAHPPGFYAIQAMAVGSLLDNRRSEAASAVGRGVNTFIGALGVVVLAQIGWSFGGRGRDFIAIALPASVVLIPTYVRTSADLYNDPAVAVVSMTTIGLAMHVVRRGPSPPIILAIALLSGAGLSLKATHVFAVIVAIVAVGVAVLRENGPKAAVARRFAVLVVPILAVPAVSIGWFYALNRRRSGSWFRAYDGAAFASLQENREPRTVVEVFGETDFWTTLPGRLFGASEWAVLSVPVQIISIVVFVLALIVGICHLIAGVRSRTGSASTPLIGLLALHFGLLTGAQIEHATGGGQFSERYFMPALLTVGVAVTALVIVLGRWAWTGLGALLALQIGAALQNAALYGHRRWPQITGDLDPFGRASALARSNQLPGWIPLVFLGGACVSALIVVVSARRSLTSVSGSGDIDTI